MTQINTSYNYQTYQSVHKIKGHTNTQTPSCVGYYLD